MDAGLGPLSPFKPVHGELIIKPTREADKAPGSESANGTFQRDWLFLSTSNNFNWCVTAE